MQHLRETRARVFSGQAAATLKDWDFASMIYARLKACVCVPNKQMHMREPQSPEQQISRLCLLPTAALSPLSHEMYHRRNPESSLKLLFMKKHSFTHTRQLLIIYFAAAIESNERGQRYARAENNGSNVAAFVESRCDSSTSCKTRSVCARRFVIRRFRRCVCPRVSHIFSDGHQAIASVTIACTQSTKQ